MKKKALSLLAMLSMSALSVSSVAMADIDYGLEVGVRSQSGDASDTTLTTNSQMGLQFGATAHFPLSGPLHLRTGMLYTQRPLVVKYGTTEDKISMNYLDIPLALMYKFEEYAGVYAGVSLAMNLDKSSSAGNTITDIKSPLVPLLIGASFKIAPDFGVALYYENASGDVAKGLKDYRAVGANLMITLD